MATFTGNSIFDILTNQFVPNGQHTFNPVNSQNLGDVEVLHFYGNQTVTSSTNINTTYFSDVSTNQDTIMCIRVFHGDLTVDTGVTFRPLFRTKGMFILVKGNLTIASGSSISMTGRGSSAGNVNVSTWGNVTISGGHGTAGASGTVTATSGTQAQTGWNGANATGRGSGGGGGGASYAVNAVAVSGAGAIGAVFGGGGGGGGIEVSRTTYTSTPLNAGNASNVSGGDGYALRPSTGTSRGAGGGAGISADNTRGGLGKYATTTTTGQDHAPYHGVYGTGGLLMVACLGTVTGTFTSNGSNGGLGFRAGGGASGGGSVNVIGKTVTGATGTATGGTGGQTQATDGTLNMFGGNGGNGTVTINALSADGVTTVPVRSLFKVGSTFYYRNFTTGQWAQATGSGTEPFEKFGMLNGEMYQIDRSMIQNIPSVNLSAVTIQTFAG